MRPVNLRVWGDGCIVRAWGDKWKWMIYENSLMGDSGLGSKGWSSISNRNR